MGKAPLRTLARPAKIGAAALLGALMSVAPPAPAAARTTVTVQITYGAVVAGGVGVVVYLGGRWDLSLAGREGPPALLEIRDGRARLGVPLPVLDAWEGPGRAPDAAPAIRVDLLRWRF
jgi:hypothetical protein